MPRAFHPVASGRGKEGISMLSGCWSSAGRGLDMKDTLLQGTPAGWAEHEGKKEVKDFLAAAAESGA
jgi:hypothetical protein